MPGIHFQDQNTEQYSNNNLTIIGYNQTMIAVDRQQLKPTGARSAGRSAACNDFIPTACLPAQHDDVGGGAPGPLMWCGQRNSDHGPRGEDLGGGRQRVGLNSSPGRLIPSSTTAALAHHMHVKRTRNRAIKCGRK
jgi:hypothetical protein